MKDNLYGTELLSWDGYNTLEECQEDTGWYHNGDYIIDTFMNGNWGDGVIELIEIGVTPYEFAEFIEEGILDEIYSHIGDFLDRPAFCNIQSLYDKIRRR